jgi:hypothetical protein
MLRQQPVLLPDALVFCLLGLPLTFRHPSPVVLVQVPHGATTEPNGFMFRKRILDRSSRPWNGVPTTAALTTDGAEIGCHRAHFSEAGASLARAILR